MKTCQRVTVRRLLSVSLPSRLNPNLILTHFTSIEKPAEKVANPFQNDDDDDWTNYPSIYS